MAYIREDCKNKKNNLFRIIMKMMKTIPSLFIKMMISISHILDLKKNEKSCKNEFKRSLVILGPSAVGKDTLINRLIKKYPEIIYKLPSYTTRKKRDNEIDGKDYFFITREEYFKMEKEENLFGKQEYNNNFYASNKKKLDEVRKDKSKIIVLNYNIETSNSIKNKSDFYFVALLPPSEEALKERLIKRNTKCDEIEKRMEKSKKELKLIEEAKYINFRITNDIEDEAFNKLENYIKNVYNDFFL